MIWFIADTHFGHANIIRYCDRPFESKQDHDQTIINNWNACVGKKDTVYHLGDFGFGSPKWLMDKIASKLHGQIILIRGNHDQGVIKDPLVNRFVQIKDVHMISGMHNNERYRIFMSHYPHRSWPFSYHGSFHLFGHVHGNLDPWGLSFDAGVDTNGFRPISLDEVFAKMAILKENWDRDKIR
jgi:calcineurin-like phosphoesterase family protein